MTLKDLSLLILNESLSTIFPDICTAILNDIYTMPVTSASDKRSFLKLKLIKNYLSNAML